MPKYLLEFEINVLPMMPNKILGSRWYVRNDHAKKWKKLIDNHISLNELRPDKPLQKAKLTLTRCSSRIPDYDGLSGSFKAVIDALVSCGIIVDDSTEIIGKSDYLHEVVGANKGKIKIRVEEI